MYGSYWDRGHFMKNFHFKTIYNITQEAKKNTDYICGFTSKKQTIKTLLQQQETNTLKIKKSDVPNIRHNLINYTTFAVI